MDAVYLSERFRLSLTEAGFAATFWLQLGSAVGILAGGALADRWALLGASRAWTQALGLGCAAPCLFLAGFTDSMTVVVAALTAFGLGRGAFDATAMPLLCELVPESLRSTGLGILNFAGVIAGGVIATSAGYLKATVGLGVLVQSAGGVLIVAAAVTAAIGKFAQTRTARA